MGRYSDRYEIIPGSYCPDKVQSDFDKQAEQIDNIKSVMKSITPVTLIEF
jgi:hypothetical protein